MKNPKNKENLIDDKNYGSGGDSSKSYNKGSNIGYYLLIGAVVLTVLIILICK